MVNSLAITSLISNKREWNNCFIKFLRLKNLKYEIRAKKARKSVPNRKKNLMRMRYCVTPSGQMDVVAHHKKNFLPFRVLLNVGIDPNFPQKSFFFLFGFIRRKISLSGENIFSLATLSAIIYHIWSN